MTTKQSLQAHLTAQTAVLIHHTVSDSVNTYYTLMQILCTLNLLMRRSEYYNSEHILVKRENGI